jgi:hypothetical protein
MTQEKFAVGVVIGTGAAINVKCGFVPRYVKLQNYTDTNFPKLEWYKGMTAAYGFLEKTGTTYIARTLITSGGISEYAGSDAAGEGQGFTIGADTDINGAADVIYYIAVR